MSGPIVSFGLHITKCAGTSFITTLRRCLQEDEYYFFSSFYANLLASRPLFPLIVNPQRIKLFFGHYLHEEYLGLFRARKVWLFTGLRDPVQRAISHYRQVNFVHIRAGRPPITAEQYLAEKHRSTICGEILRAFPTISRDKDEAIWRKALRALSLFDYVYSLENFAQEIRPVFDKLKVQDVQIVTDNKSDDVPISQADHAYLAAEGQKLSGVISGYLEDDLKLYDFLKRHLGHDKFVKSFEPKRVFNGEAWCTSLDDLRETLPNSEECKRRIVDRETEYLVNEIKLVGKAQFLYDHLRFAITQYERILERLDYTPSSS